MKDKSLAQGETKDKILAAPEVRRLGIAEETEKLSAAPEVERLGIPEVISVGATEFQNNFSKYRKLAMAGTQVNIKVNGKEVLRFEQIRTAHFSDLAGMLDGKLGEMDAYDIEEFKWQEFKKTRRI